MLSHKNFGTMMKLMTRFAVYPFYAKSFSFSHFNTHIFPYIDPDFEYRREHQLLMLPFYHIYGFGTLINCVLNGSTGVVLDAFHQETFCRSIEQYRFRWLYVVPPILIWLSRSQMIHKYDFSSVSLLMTGNSISYIKVYLIYFEY